MLGPHGKDVEIFWGHGDSDPLISSRIADASVDMLKGQIGNSKVEYHKYAGLEHSADPKELQDLAEWLVRVIG